MKIKITADSTADLSQELADKFDIGIIPLVVNLGEEEYLDGETINPDMIYDYVRKTKKLPKTSAVNTVQYKEHFEKYLSGGYDAIIHFNISSEMSTTHNNAKLVCEEMQNIFVVDSRTLSTGTALLAMYASELAQTGKYSPHDIVEMVEARRNTNQTSFIIDRLEYLYRGGRCNTIALLGANLLKIKPSIEVHEGKMGMAKRYMGNFQKSVMKYVADTLAKYNNPDYTRVFITHTEIDPEIVEEIKKYLKENTRFKEILETTAGSTVTSHCGPHTIGILYLNDGENHY
ncbi:MAG: DegV family protein [Clostridia bacterium]|nr:DegV family protein [Clostridia bacterium]